MSNSHSDRCWADYSESESDSDVDSSNDNAKRNAQLNYARGFLIPRLIKNDDIDSNDMGFKTYKSEENIMTPIVQTIDPVASLIRMIPNEDNRYCATYVYTIHKDMTREKFLSILAPPYIEYSFSYFHGLFDSISNILDKDDKPFEIQLVASDTTMSQFNIVGKKLFGDDFVMIHKYNTREDIERIYNLIYFNHNIQPGEEYTYAVNKEKIIKNYLDGKSAKDIRDAKTKKSTRDMNIAKVPNYNKPHTPQVSRQTAKTINVTRTTKALSKNSVNNRPIVRIKRIRDDAVIPSYATDMASGADIHVTHFIKEVNGIQFYGTGLVIQPYTNTYTQLVARSSLPKKGYMLANSVGIIDADYRGELMVQLIPTPHTGDARITEFPMSIGQLLVTPVYQYQYVEVDDLSDTVRGSGGFGSTDTLYTPLYAFEKGVNPNGALLRKEK